MVVLHSQPSKFCVLTTYIIDHPFPINACSTLMFKCVFYPSRGSLVLLHLSRNTQNYQTWMLNKKRAQKNAYLTRMYNLYRWHICSSAANPYNISSKYVWVYNLNIIITMWCVFWLVSCIQYIQPLKANGIIPVVNCATRSLASVKITVLFNMNMHPSF